MSDQEITPQANAVISELAHELDVLLTNSLIAFMDKHCEKSGDSIGSYKTLPPNVVNAIFNVMAGFTTTQLYVIKPFCGRGDDDILSFYIKALKFYYKDRGNELHTEHE